MGLRSWLASEDAADDTVPKEKQTLSKSGREDFKSFNALNKILALYI